ncbi:MAG: tyrosine-protein phosphatase [Alistipes sp.]|nr:tyrosine-protein phosphatase [Alistipes sp.]
MKKSMAVALAAVFAVTLAGCKNSMKTKETGYSGEDISGIIEILRDRDTKTASVHISEDTEWALYAGPTVEDIDITEAVESGRADGDFPIDVPSDTRSYFQVVTPEGRAIMAERHLPMSGGFNFRDLGGYRMQDGRYVKWGKLLRSDEMNNLTEEDLTYLASVPLVSVVDFRSEEEIAKAPDRLPSTVTHHYAYSIAPGNLSENISLSKMPTEEEAVSLMEDINRLFVSDGQVVGQYRRLFELLADEANAPLLFHCTAGKDRTGIAAALILYALGADDETVMRDYLLSGQYAAVKYDALTNRFPELGPFMTVRQNYLDAALREIDDRYGSVAEYLTGTLGADLEALREIYLY